MTIKYRKNLIGLAVLFYAFGAFWFVKGFHFSGLQALWMSELGEKINFLIMIACIIEAFRNFLIYILRPDRLKIKTNSVIIIGLLRNKTLNFADILKVTLCFAEDNDSFGLKRKISIDTIFGKPINISIFPLEFDTEKFVLALKNQGVDVGMDS